MFSHLFNHAGGAPRARRRVGDGAAKLTFSAGNGLLAFALFAGSDENQKRKPGRVPVTFVSKLSIVAAYVAIAFVGAIVLGVF